MTVKRIVANIASQSVPEVAAFYADLFGLEVAMDHGWINTLTAPTTATTQVSIASEGGSGTPVPNLSIEVEDVDATHARALALGVEVVYPPTNEPWGVRRFYIRDPAGTLLNILTHRP